MNFNPPPSFSNSHRLFFVSDYRVWTEPCFILVLSFPLTQSGIPCHILFGKPCLWPINRKGNHKHCWENNSLLHWDSESWPEIFSNADGTGAHQGIYHLEKVNLRKTELLFFFHKNCSMFLVKMQQIIRRCHLSKNKGDPPFLGDKILSTSMNLTLIPKLVSLTSSISKETHWLSPCS